MGFPVRLSLFGFSVWRAVCPPPVRPPARPPARSVAILAQAKCRSGLTRDSVAQMTGKLCDGQSIFLRDSGKIERSYDGDDAPARWGGAGRGDRSRSPPRIAGELGRVRLRAPPLLRMPPAQASNCPAAEQAARGLVSARGRQGRLDFCVDSTEKFMKEQVPGELQARQTAAHEGPGVPRGGVEVYKNMEDRQSATLPPGWRAYWDIERQAFYYAQEGSITWAKPDRKGTVKCGTRPTCQVPW